jgi:hypothetical protein
MPELEKRVAAANDDIEEKSSGSISANVSDLELGFDGSTAQKVGIRFSSLDIPQAAQITAAYIQFTADETSSGSASLLIRGQASDTAAPFANVGSDVSSRPVTAASVGWAPGAWTAGASGLAQQTADISAIVQEIVNRSGWTPSNAMAFVISGTGTRTAESFEDKAAAAPLLHIEYVLPGGGGSPVGFNAQPDANPATNEIAELGAAGAASGITASARDPDAGDSVTYSIDDPRFTIGASSGVITRSGTGTLDFETEPSVTLTVTALSSDNSTATREFTLNILDSQEPVGFNTPADANSATNTISQSAAAGTAVGITASARDPDAGDTVSYFINDSRFAISSSGVITRLDTGSLNAQNEPSITLRVTATSSDSSTSTQDYTLAVTGPVGGPVEFNAQPDSNPATNQIAELAAAGAASGITASARDPDAGDSVTYSINDPRFTIGASSGVITRSSTGTLDFETESSVTLMVTARSSDNSTATRQFTLNVLNSQEPVGFNTPADANSATNTISQSAAAGTAVGITASARDPDAGDTVSYSINDSRFAISSSGVITRSGSGSLNAQTEPSINLAVMATSSDSSTSTHDYTLAVTGSGGGGGLPSSLSLVRTTLTSQWSPSSPDPSGLAYINHLGTMLVVDGEVDELAIFTGKNVFEMRPNGTLVSSASVFSFSDEPAGIAYNPNNRHLYISDDTGSRGFYDVNPGNDARYFTSDDTVTFANTGPFGASDAEGVAYDPTRGVIYLASGANQKIFTISPGANGRFDGAPSKGGDDVATSFDTIPLGIHDPESIEYDPVHDVLFVPASRTSIAMLTPDGELLDTFNVSQVNARKLAGLALAPSSGDPIEMSLYVADRGIDNNQNPNENDGKIYEFLLVDDLLA